MANAEKGFEKHVHAADKRYLRPVRDTVAIHIHYPHCYHTAHTSVIGHHASHGHRNNLSTRDAHLGTNENETVTELKICCHLTYDNCPYGVLPAVH